VSAAPDPAPDSTGAGPTLWVAEARGDVNAVVLVLHGGRSRSTDRTSPRHLAYLRMRPFAATVHRDLADRGVAVWLLRYRVRGWNGDRRDPVHDAGWALDEIARRHPGVPVVLVGHSMGGRTALHVAGADHVVGVCALAPWIEPADPVRTVAGRVLVIAHGTRDRMTDPAASRRYASEASAAGAEVAYFAVPGERHAMLHRARDWNTLVRDSVRYALGILPAGQVGAVMARPAAERLGVDLAPARRDPAAPDPAPA
jgi:acetyl esterase/lipase